MCIAHRNLIKLFRVIMKMISVLMAQHTGELQVSLEQRDFQPIKQNQQLFGG